MSSRTPDDYLHQKWTEEDVRAHHRRQIIAAHSTTLYEAVGNVLRAHLERKGSEHLTKTLRAELLELEERFNAITYDLNRFVKQDDAHDRAFGVSGPSTTSYPTLAPADRSPAVDALHPETVRDRPATSNPHPDST